MMSGTSMQVETKLCTRHLVQDVMRLVLVRGRRPNVAGLDDHQQEFR